VYDGFGLVSRRRTTYRVNALAFAGETRVVTANSDRALRVWSLEPEARLLCELAGHGADLFDVAVPPGGTRAIAIDGGGALKVWDLARDPCVRVVPIDGGSPPVALARDAGGTMVVSGVLGLCGYDPAHAAPETPVQTFAWGPAGLRGAAVSPDGARVAAWGTVDGRWFSLHLFDAHTGARSHALDDRLTQVGGASFSGDGARIVATTSDGMVRAWDCATGALLAERALSDAPAFDVAHVRGGRLAAVDAAGRLLLVDATLEGAVAEVPAHAGRAVSLAVSPNGATIATGGDDFAVRLWDADDGAARAVLRGHDRPVYDLDFAPGRARLASLDADGEIRIWWLGPDREVFSLRPPCRTFGIAWTARSLCACSENGLLLWP
jgi:WD40 repeat protein